MEIDFVALMNEYGLLAVIVGVAASILTGALKMPIKISLNKKATEQKTALMAEFVTAEEDRKAEIVDELNAIELKVTNTITLVCNLFVAFFAVAGVLIFYGVTVKSWTIFIDSMLYKDIMATFLVSKIAFAFYEKCGIKKLVLKIIAAIKNKTAKNSPLNNVLDVITRILENDVQLPLTDEQKTVLTEKYNETFKK